MPTSRRTAESNSPAPHNQRSHEGPLSALLQGTIQAQQNAYYRTTCGTCVIEMWISRTRAQRTSVNVYDKVCDLAGVGAARLGFTPLSEALSDGELATFIREFEQDATGIVASHGGRLVKLIGDEPVSLSSLIDT